MRKAVQFVEAANMSASPEVLFAKLLNDPAQLETLWRNCLALLGRADVELSPARVRPPVASRVPGRASWRCR
jgi:hypothetical protein